MHIVSYMACLFSLYIDESLSVSIGGSVVEFSPATREARVRFPANALVSFGRARDWLHSLKKDNVTYIHT